MDHDRVSVQAGTLFVHPDAIEDAIALIAFSLRLAWAFGQIRRGVNIFRLVAACGKTGSLTVAVL